MLTFSKLTSPPPDDIVTRVEQAIQTMLVGFRGHHEQGLTGLRVGLSTECNGPRQYASNNPN